MTKGTQRQRGNEHDFFIVSYSVKLFSPQGLLQWV